VRAVAYDRLTSSAIAERFGLPRVVLFATTTSTMDEAHKLAEKGAPAGTLVVAEEQTAGRGRNGASWLSRPGSSVVFTLVERPHNADALGVLSLRMGLGAAAALDAMAGESIRLKWPNDLYVGDRKIAGVLVETRWREGRAEWAAIALGVNIGDPPAGLPNAGGLPGHAPRIDVLEAVVRAARAAAKAAGPLTAAERKEWARRDWLAGKRVTEPLRGVVRGILATGELVVETEAGPQPVNSGTVTLEAM
jgi:BirA family biotin operon repressor/biotin-[acetyl-CoA-carboxylase] ligase